MFDAGSRVAACFYMEDDCYIKVHYFWTNFLSEILYM
jgi:hypothetical protein